MSYKPSDAVTVQFCTQRFDTGAATNADSLPTGTVTKNGTDDGTVTVTVTNLATGRYKAAFTVPSGYAAGDVVELTIAATVNSVAGKGLVWRAQLDSKRNADLQDLSQANVRSAVGLASANLDTQLSNINVKTTNLPASPAATGDAMTLTGAYDFAKGTVAMTESYAATGATMTPIQALHMLWSLLSNRSIAGLTLTAKKLDGTTTAMTFTLDSATAPASQVRAT